MRRRLRSCRSVLALGMTSSKETSAAMTIASAVTSLMSTGLVLRVWAGLSVGNCLSPRLSCFLLDIPRIYRHHGATNGEGNDLEPRIYRHNGATNGEGNDLEPRIYRHNGATNGEGNDLEPRIYRHNGATNGGRERPRTSDLSTQRGEERGKGKMVSPAGSSSVMARGGRGTADRSNRTVRRSGRRRRGGVSVA
uniref:Uncharacterized protein n=1 Tax=Aegilops tauschii subsp. strangulata TaxID=200361 RepID=A0A453Q4X6_AEGTS